MKSVSEMVLWKDWVIKDKIGQGSFGDVYKAETDAFGATRYCAVKHIALPKSSSEVQELINQGFIKDVSEINEYYKDTIQDITRECEIMYRLRASENIVDYQDHIIQPKEDGIGYDVFIRMELLKSVDEYFKDKTVTENDVIALGIDICSALEACHGNGIIHRDIKSGNIFINEVGKYKLGDFGVARQLEKTTYGMSKKGTYNYMAPEIYKGEQVNLTADIYSLGIVLYRLLNNNRCPFLNKLSDNVKFSENEEALLRRMSGEEIPPIFSVDPELMKVILRAVEYDRRNRYQSVSDMKKDLQKVLDGEEVIIPEKVVSEKEASSLDRTISTTRRNDNVSEDYKKQNEIITDEKGRAEINFEKCSKLTKTLNIGYLVIFALGIIQTIIKGNSTNLNILNTIVYNFNNSLVMIPVVILLTTIAYKLLVSKRILVKYGRIINFINIGLLTIFAKNLIDFNLRVGTGLYIFFIANILMIVTPSKWSLGQKYVMMNSMFEKDIRRSMKLKRYYETEDDRKKINYKIQLGLGAVSIILLLITLKTNATEFAVQSNPVPNATEQIVIVNSTPIKEKQENADVFNKSRGMANVGEVYQVIEKIEVKLLKYNYIKIQTANGITGYVKDTDVTTFN